MIMYKASYYGEPKIEEVEVTGTTAKMVVLKGGQKLVKMRTKQAGYFDGEVEAKKFLSDIIFEIIAEASIAIERLEYKLEAANKHYVKVNYG